jgi:hypothetical protein
MHTEFWLENFKGRDNIENLAIDRKVLEWILGKWGGKVWTVSNSSKIGTGDWLLGT